MIIFVVVLGAVIIALLGYLGYAIDEAYIQGYCECYEKNFEKVDSILEKKLRQHMLEVDEDDGK